MFPMDALNTEAVIKNVQPGKGYLSVSDPACQGRG